jgi:ABC-2 type transport system ATP-binding protein
MFMASNMSDTDVLIEFRDLTKTFSPGARPALDRLDGTVRAGAITGLVGPDGAGKTTLIRILAGLLLPSAGDLQVLGFDPRTEPEAIRLRIGYMPQRFGLYEDLSVIQNLNLYADLRDVIGPEREQRFEQLLSFTDLKRFNRRKAGALSGGMKQKLGLACSLVGKPELLLLDEPGVGVDPISRRDLWKIVQDLVQEGIGVIWSTAYLDEAELCQEVILLHEGKTIFNGKPGDLTRRVANRTFRLRVKGNRRQALATALRQPEVVDGVVQGDDLRLIFAQSAKTDRATGRLGDGATGREAMSVREQNGEWHPDDLQSVPPRFEDAFIDALGGPTHRESEVASSLQLKERDGAAVIEAKELTKKFGDFAATDRVTFSVTRGELFGLLGPNGAGKSTTFKMMCGLLKPTSGTARVAGLDLQHSGSAARNRIGYMAQKFSLYGDLTTRQNLEFFAGVYGLRGQTRSKVIDRMIDVFGLEPYLPTSSGQLPLGFKQRLAMACAIMHQPDVLFLDEPTSGVDPITRREFWSHINGLVEKGVTVMVTTHFMEEAEYCDRIGLVYRGKLIALDTPDRLRQSVRGEDQTAPGMEEAFIRLIRKWDAENRGGYNGAAQ